MPIEFHCPRCNKLIRAPDDAGGRHGKCPYCKESVYIPTPPEEIEEIPLAPISREAEEEERRLLEETRRLTAALDREEPPKYDTAEPASAAAGSALPLPREEEADIPDLVVDYLLAMAGSEIGRADGAVRQLRRHAPQARTHLKRLLAGKLPPPDLGTVPDAVYKGFLRTLLEQL